MVNESQVDIQLDIDNTENGQTQDRIDVDLTEQRKSIVFMQVDE